LWIAENNPVLAKSMTGASLSNGLKRLEKHGKIETVRRGKGSMPTVYRRKKAGEKMV
jgi:DNA-binding transcriptional ArsR family regulator